MAANENDCADAEVKKQKAVATKHEYDVLVIRIKNQSKQNKSETL